MEQIFDTPEKMALRAIQLEEQEKLAKEEYEKSKKDHNFVKFFRDAMPEIRWLSLNNPKAFAIFMFIVEHMDYKNALMCSYQVLEDYFEVSKSTITRSIRFLKENGFIDVLKSGTSNVYIINSEVAWASWANQKEYSKFNGNILVSRKENKDYQYRKQFDKFKTLREREKIK